MRQSLGFLCEYIILAGKYTSHTLLFYFYIYICLNTCLEGILKEIKSSSYIYSTLNSLFINSPVVQLVCRNATFITHCISAFSHITSGTKTVWKTPSEALYMEKRGLRANEVWQWWRVTDNRWEALSKNMTCLPSWVRKQHNDTIYLLPPLTGNCCSVYLRLLGDWRGLSF